jgi:5-methylcytosine-specific restriction endonuclease McrA
MFLLRNWRTSVYKRDNYICYSCKIRGGTLNAHHIHSFNNNNLLRYNIDNGITLCKKCHRKFHKLFGFGNNNKHQLEKFLNIKHLMTAP